MECDGIDGLYIQRRHTTDETSYTALPCGAGINRVNLCKPTDNLADLSAMHLSPSQRYRRRPTGSCMVPTGARFIANLGLSLSTPTT
jgi:hypothetical protein